MRTQQTTSYKRPQYIFDEQTGFAKLEEIVRVLFEEMPRSCEKYYT